MERERLFFIICISTSTLKGNYESPTDVNVHTHKLQRHVFNKIQGSLIPETLKTMTSTLTDHEGPVEKS